MFRNGRELDGPEAKNEEDMWKDLESDVARGE